jgi:hypothetical protein
LGLSWWKEGLRFFILAFGLLMLSQFVLKQTMMVSDCMRMREHCIHQCLVLAAGIGSGIVSSIMTGR